MGGVAFQMCCILVFLFYAYTFHRNIIQQSRAGTEGVSKVLPFVYACYAVLLLITVYKPILLQSLDTDVLYR